MRDRNAFLVTCVLVAWATAASAHEGGRHTKLMGTVGTIDQRHVVVKTTDGKDESVQLDDQTTCSEDKRDASCSSIKAGDRVVVTTRTREGALIADQIRFSGSMKGAGSSEAPQHEGHEHSHMEGPH